MATASTCPVVGTTNTVLPPSHPDVDLSKPGQICPVVGATTDHHPNLDKHPKIPLSPGADANQCPALEKVVSQPEAQAMDDAICPVVGTATTVLPPDHPSTKDAPKDAVCPVTKAQVGHHAGKIHQHPSVDSAAKGAVCPVTGAKA